MRHTFLAARWVGEALERYRNRPPKATIKGKRIVFSERHYLAALLHIYVGGGLSLSQVANLARLPVEEVRFQRTQIDFLTLADYLKTKFSEWYREMLQLEDFSLDSYAAIAWEFNLLEEMVRSQVKIPLLHRLKILAYDIDDYLQGGKEPDEYDRRVFRRLFTFFQLIEAIRPTLTRRLLERDMIPLAQRSLGAEIEPILSWRPEEEKQPGLFSDLLMDIQEVTEKSLS
ncbi:hypothetical protein G4V39_09895 [Thermosulfuriphilus ammonigenes]|uniref:Uncharacterized protein n=1 Tax=Thermosulfuriphilus ammonigenes TaxID=1936021 RepID=A0A6G7PXZ8_9BACT|nr:hypothetical protein [Thermosulfuriphilus ammonigenes]MBA2849498.1 hypothetical protein [Thermosulfuriphilus ammonigenes]QIJ72564.1 hypothetical protein G4V39_09895 [Thermosulfuriphilus ammonigenes]